MTLEDALTVLGVEAAATEDEVRRAYLRLVKKHRPETDPTGFQRVREAYDRARELRPNELEPLVSAPATTVPEASMEPGGDGDQVNPTTASDSEADLELFRRLALELAVKDPAGTIEIWRSAVRRHPDSAEARWELIEAYFQAGKPKRAGRALLRAYRRGLPGFAAALLARSPGHAPAELCEQAMHDPTLAFAAASGWVNTGNPSAALPYLEARLELESGDGVGGFMLAHVVIVALSRLGEEGDVAQFGHLVQLFSNYLKHHETALRGPAPAQWLVLCELAATADMLPRFVFRALAESVVKQDGMKLTRRLASYAQEYPHGAAEAKEVLRRQAPGLYSAYAPLLAPAAPVGPPPEWRPRGFGWPGIGTLFVAAFMSLRLCIPSEPREDDARPTAATWAPSTAPRDILGRVVTTPPRHDQAIVHRAVSNLCSLAQDHDLPDLEVRAVTVAEAFTGDCATLASEMGALTQLTRNQNTTLVTEVQVLSNEFHRACPHLANPVHEP